MMSSAAGSAVVLVAALTVAVRGSQARELAELRKTVDQTQQQLEEEVARAAISKSMSEENITGLTQQV